MIFNSYSFAEVTNSAPTTALSKIASSMGYSAKITSQNALNINNATSKLLNSSKLTAGIQKSAEKYGLSIDSEAATILAGVDTSSSASISQAMAKLEENVEGRSWDYVPTLDQDTILYDSGWFDLTPVETGSNGLTYSLGDEGVSQVLTYPCGPPISDHHLFQKAKQNLPASFFLSEQSDFGIQ